MQNLQSWITNLGCRQGHDYCDVRFQVHPIRLSDPYPLTQSNKKIISLLSDNP
jgi:hypothetical protein